MWVGSEVDVDLFGRGLETRLDAPDDGFVDIPDGLIQCFALGHAPGEIGALHDVSPFFILFNEETEFHRAFSRTTWRHSDIKCRKRQISPR